MKKIFPAIAFCLLSGYGLLAQANADENVPTGNAGDAGVALSFSGNVMKSTCDIHFQSDILIIDSVRLSIFTGPGSQSVDKWPLLLFVDNCENSAQTRDTLKLSFDAFIPDGTVSPGAFTNQAVDQNNTRINNGVGFAVYDIRDNKNVLTSAGLSREISYAVDARHPLNQSRDFYVKYMQTSPTVTSGPVEAVLTVSAYYD